MRNQIGLMFGISALLVGPALAQNQQPNPNSMTVLAMNHYNTDTLVCFSASQPPCGPSVAAGSTSQEYFWLTGPSTSSDTAAQTFSTTIQWLIT